MINCRKAPDKSVSKDRWTAIPIYPPPLPCGGYNKSERCVCETLMPPKHPSFEKHDPDI